MRDYGSMMSEFSAAFQFPYYFTDTYDGLAECLSDLDWIPALSYKMIILDSNSILNDDLTERPAFFRALRAAQENLWVAEHDLKISNRPRTRLEIILQVEETSRDALVNTLSADGLLFRSGAIDAV